MFWVGMIVGGMIGAIVGIVVIALCVSASAADKRMGVK